jgi:hypothetical protein
MRRNAFWACVVTVLVLVLIGGTRVGSLQKSGPVSPDNIDSFSVSSNPSTGADNRVYVNSKYKIKVDTVQAGMAPADLRDLGTVSEEGTCYARSDVPTIPISGVFLRHGRPAGWRMGLGRVCRGISGGKLSLSGRPLNRIPNSSLASLASKPKDSLLEETSKWLCMPLVRTVDKLDLTGRVASVFDCFDISSLSLADGYSPLFDEVSAAPAMGVAPTGDGIKKFFAIIVGISTYQHEEKLSANIVDWMTGLIDVDTPWLHIRNHANDATAVRDTLLLGADWHETNIQLVLDSAGTKVGIHNALHSTGADDDDVIVFYFAGWGNQIPDDNDDEADDIDETLTPYDWDPADPIDTEIRDDELRGWLQSGLMGGAEILVVLSSHFSGGVARDLPSDSHKIVAIGGCGELEGIDQDWYLVGMGDFTYYFLTGMLPPGPADTNNNGWISAGEIYAYSTPGWDSPVLSFGVLMAPDLLEYFNRDDRFENNDVVEDAARVVDGTYTGLNVGEGLFCLDDDWYAIYLTTGGSLDFVVDCVDPNFAFLDANVHIYDTDGVSVIATGAGPASSFTFTWPGVPAAGLYFIRVEYTGDVEGHEYDLIISRTKPEMMVTGLTHEIKDGDNSPEKEDGTYFGLVSVGSTVAHDFTIENTGDAPLHLTGGPLIDFTDFAAMDFSITVPPVSPVPAGGSTTFTVSMTTTMGGPRRANLRIPNEDEDEGFEGGPYNYDVEGGDKIRFRDDERGGSGGGCSLGGSGDGFGWSFPYLLLSVVFIVGRIRRRVSSTL